MTTQRFIKKLTHQLFPRDESEQSFDKLHDFLHNKRILITGAGGFIGQELIHQIMPHSPQCLLALDQQELGLHQLLTRYELNNAPLNPTLKLILGSTLDKVLLKNIFEQYKPEVIFHAAAYKHVYLVEQNPHFSFMNNVLGTQLVTQMAIDHEATHVILISSDKAIQPVNAMGISKNLSECLMGYFAQVQTKTDCLIVRFGNVFGSSGSLITKILSQLKSGHPITVTHPEAERFFMSVNEAIDLTLQATQLYHASGDVLALDMGKPYPILPLIHRVIDLYREEYGSTSFPSIQEIGLYPGERLQELPLIDPSSQATDNPKIYRQTKYLPCPADEFRGIMRQLENRWLKHQDYQDLLDQLYRTT